MNLPSISIIIPTYSRPQQLSDCLAALSRLNYPPSDFEVIVVDDGNPIQLDEVVKLWQSKLLITLLKQSNQGPAAARNLGADHAEGQLLAFTDDDCTPATDWLQKFSEQFSKNPNSLMGGQTINALPNNLYATTSHLLVDFLYDYYNGKDAKIRQTRFFTSNNFSISKQIFQRLGGFSLKFPLAAGEDRELCDRALQLGYEMLYVPEALVYHAHHLTFVQFCQQHFNYGRGAIHFNQVRATRNLGKIKPESSPFYLNLLLYPFKKGFSSRSYLISMLLFLTQFAHSAGCFWERQKASNQSTV